jgi:hypothetical protein
MRQVTALSILLCGLIMASAPAGAELFQRHADGKIWKYDGGGQCSATACPGWILIDQNPATQDIAAGHGGLYQLHKDGRIWRYDGQGRCANNACPGWTLIDKNPATRAIAGGPGGLYQHHADGKLWKYDGHGQCTNKLCPGWTLIDKNPATKDFVAANATLFQRHQDGKIWRYDGRGQCSETACPGWAMIDNNAATQMIAGGSGGFYQRHADGKIWKYDGQSQCSTTACPGWANVDKNPATQTIAAGGHDLYQLHGDGKYWKYDGRSQCSASACPGWANIDKNPATRQIVSSQDTAYQRHVDGKIWKYDGHSTCSANACPGWTNIDKNPATAAILAVESGPSPALGDLLAGSPVRGVVAVRDDINRAIFSNTAFFTSASLCHQVLTPQPGKPPLEQRIKDMVGERLASSPFKMRSDSSATLSRGCNAHAELAGTGRNDIRVTVNLPQNSFSLMLTTPDVHVLGISIGAPGSLDPHAVITFDVQIQVVINVPDATGGLLTSNEPTGTVTNVHLDPKNVTAGALVAVNDVVRFFGGDLLRPLTRDRTLDLHDVGDFLGQFNAQLRLLPPGVGFVSSYDRGAATLVLRTAQ